MFNARYVIVGHTIHLSVEGVPENFDQLLRIAFRFTSFGSVEDCCFDTSREGSSK